MLIPKDKGGPAITLPCALRTGSPRGGAGTYPALRVEDWFTEAIDVFNVSTDRYVRV